MISRWGHSVVRHALYMPARLTKRQELVAKTFRRSL